MEGDAVPIAPPSLSIKIKNQNKSITLINEGEINILKMAGLSEISFDAKIPQVKLPYANYSGGFKGAEYFLNKFERLKTGQKPFQFIVSRVRRMEQVCSTITSRFLWKIMKSRKMLMPGLKL
jgi:hypothetical protein